MATKKNKAGVNKAPKRRGPKPLIPEELDIDIVCKKGNLKPKLTKIQKTAIMDYLSTIGGVIQDKRLNQKQQLFIIASLCPDTALLNDKQLGQVLGCSARTIQRCRLDPLVMSAIRNYSKEFVYSQFIPVIQQISNDVITSEDPNDRARAARALVKIAEHLNPRPTTKNNETPAFNFYQTFSDNPNAAKPTEIMTEPEMNAEVIEHVRKLGYDVSKAKLEKV